MTNRKNGFWTFVFSPCTGAGKMYMALYKQGISRMVLFWGLGIICGWAHLELLWFLEPVIWFYSFFHVHNLRGMPDEEFCRIEDRFLWEDYIETDRNWKFTEKNKRMFASVLIIFGIYVLFQGLFHGLLWYLPDFIWRAFDAAERIIPRLLVGIGVIYAGVKMLKKERDTPNEGGQKAEI